jgi:hypothetical protein
MLLPDGVAVNSVHFEMDSLSGAERAFAVKSFYEGTSKFPHFFACMVLVNVRQLKLGSTVHHTLIV